MPASYPIVELRQYTLHAGKRDTLIALFEQEFVESQEAVGMKVFGQFVDLDNPDRFVWLRGYKDMDSRAAGLNAFYYGPVWQAHREAANATLLDNDNVLLLRAAGTNSVLREGPPRATAGSPNPASLVVANIYYLNGSPAEFANKFERSIAPALKRAGVSVLASFVRETAANNFPRLPVREGENVFVWLARYADQSAYDESLAALECDSRWAAAKERLAAALARPPEVLRLQPTPRSELR